MTYSFGDDAVFSQLKKARASGDQNALAVLLFQRLEPVIRSELKKTAFAMFTAEDREDASQEARLYVLQKLDDFLDNPLNDPSCEDENRFTPVKRQSWAHRVVFHALLHVRDRIKKHAIAPGGDPGQFTPIDSLDRELGDNDQGTLADVVPDNQGEPIGALLQKERLEEACRAFFGLNNSPEMLAAVGFVILSESLAGTHYPLDTYADMLNGMPADRIVALIERLLTAYTIDVDVLSGIKKRLGGKERVINGLTAKKLANRKNSMLSVLRAGPAAEEEE